MLRLIFSLAIMVPVWALFGVAGASNGAGDTTTGLIVGSLLGVFFGVVLGGVKGKWVDAIFEPEDKTPEN